MTPTEEAILSQFKDLTAYQDEQHEQILLLMEQCNWDITMACGRFFDNQLPSVSQPTQESRQQQLNDFQLPLRNQAMTIMYPRAIPISSKWKFNPGLVKKQSPLIWVLLLVPNLLFWLLSKLGSLFGIVDTDPFDTDPIPYHASISALKPYNILEDVKRVLDKEKDLVELPLWRGEFNDAFQLAKREHQFLLMILVNIPDQGQDDEVSEVTKLFLQLIFSKEFKKYMDSQNIILFLGNVSHPESHLLAKSYRVTKVPHVSILSNLQSGDFSLLKRWDNVMNVLLMGSDNDKNVEKLANKFIFRLNRVIELHDPNLVVLRSEKQERDLARILREDQDRQYEEMLAKDKELFKKKEEEREIKRLEEEREQLLQAQREQEELKKEHTRHCILKSFVKKHLDPSISLSEGKYTKIQFRKQNGSRFIRQFNENCTCNDIFELIEALEYVKEIMHDDDNKDEVKIIDEICSQSEIEDIDSSDWHFNFELISPMPRLKLEPTDLILSDIRELWPNGSLLIEKMVIDEDDEDDEDE